MKPYVGIAGITARDESKDVADQFYENGLKIREGSHQGLMGYCLTSGMINRRDEMEPRYIGLDDLRILNKPLVARNVIHYSSDPDVPESFINDIYNIFLKSGIYESSRCRTLQINRAFNVSVESFDTLKEEIFPAMEIIFQAGPDDITKISPKALVKKIQPYSDYIDSILLDSSYGTGRKMDVAVLAPYITALEEAFPKLMLSFAGGLKPENVASQITALILLTTRPFSIDVESGVRNESDALDLDKTGAFIKRATQELERLYPRPAYSVPDSTLG